MAPSNNEIVFTVITPVYNGEKFIEETINSVLRCTDKGNSEVLVVDDGSTDSTPEILKGFGDSIIVITQRNSGQSSAINHGLKFAKGTFSIIVNADDPLCSGQLFEEALSVFSKQGEIVAVYPDWQIINDSGGVVRTIQVKEFSRLELVGNFNCLIGPGGIFRTSIAREVGGWSSAYKFVPDYDFWLKLSAFGDFKRIPGVHALWREHEESISVKSKGLEMANERIRVISDHIFERGQDANIEKLALSNAFFHAAILGFFDARIPARTWFFRAAHLSPINILRKKKKTIIYLSLYPLSRLLFSRLLRLSFLKSTLINYR